MTEVLMPRLADSMEEGTVTEWLKQIGEPVAAGEPLVQIETDKATLEYEAEQDGVVAEILVAEGDTVAVGTPICRLQPRSAPAAPDETVNGGAGGRAPDGGPAPPDAGAPAAEPSPVATLVDGVAATPVARRVAREHGLDLRTITGTGPGGRVLKADVHAALAAAMGAATPAAPEPVAQAAPGPDERGAVRSVALTRAELVAARRMAQSTATIPHFHLQMDVDMGAAADLRARLRSLAGDGRQAPSVNDLIVRACALALRRHERLNASFRDGHLDVYERVNIGIAVAADHGLLVPTVADADRLDVFAIAQRTRALAERVRAQTVTPAELSGATFTVSNLGMFGIRSFQPVINPPQVAILAVGELRPESDRTLMTATLAGDHRAIDGAAGARFLRELRALLEEPLQLLV